MRPQALGLFFLVIATVATAQWLEKTIYLPDSAGPQMLCYNPLSRKLYCANEWNCTITVIDGASNAILAHIPVATHPSAICINSLNKVYCAGENSTLLTVIDGTGDSVIKTIDIGATSYIIGSNPTTNKIYCGGNETPTVILDGCADTVLKVLYEESGTYSIWCDPNINKVYIGSAEFWGVRIYDGNADTLLAGIFTQTRFPSAIIGNPNHPKVYSAGTDCDTIWVIDTHADTVMRKITVPNRSSVQDLCYAPDYDRLYCATEREMDAWLMIVDGQTDSLLN
ncbi:MAG: YncE family protein, partial [candidate division WOR-3 bacterium]